jgi:hypothetical protein
MSASTPMAIVSRQNVIRRWGPIATFLRREKQQALVLAPTNHPLTLTRR